MRKEWSELIRRAKLKGWDVTQRKNGHLTWIAPNGVRIWSSSTASDLNAIHRHIATMKRLGGWDG